MPPLHHATSQGQAKTDKSTAPRTAPWPRWDSNPRQSAFVGTLCIMAVFSLSLHYSSVTSTYYMLQCPDIPRQITCMNHACTCRADKTPHYLSFIHVVSLGNRHVWNLGTGEFYQPTQSHMCKQGSCMYMSFAQQICCSTQTGQHEPCTATYTIHITPQYVPSYMLLKEDIQQILYTHSIDVYTYTGNWHNGWRKNDERGKNYLRTIGHHKSCTILYRW